MDEHLQQLRRNYRATGDQQIGAKFYATIIRTTDLVDQLEDQCIKEVQHWIDNEIPKVQTVYIAWDPLTQVIRTGIIVLYVFSGLEQSPPKPKMEQFMSHEEQWEYNRSWNDYLSQARGDMHVFACQSTLNDNGFWDSNCQLVASPGITSMVNVKNILLNSHWKYQRHDVVLMSLLDIEVDFQEELEDEFEELEERSEVIFGSCEDYPCCGHDICPPRWYTGEQAAMVCTCGALLSSNARYSICDSCLGEGGYDDFGYLEEPDYEDDYEDEDDEEDDYEDEDDEDNEDDYDEDEGF